MTVFIINELIVNTDNITVLRKLSKRSNFNRYINDNTINDVAGEYSYFCPIIWYNTWSFVKINVLIIRIPKIVIILIEFLKILWDFRNKYSVKYTNVDVPPIKIDLNIKNEIGIELSK